MTDHNLTPEQERHVESHAPYFKVFGALLALTILEYVYASFVKPPFLTLIVGLMAMALIKAAMVAWYFMHLKFEGRWIYLMVIPVLILATILTVALIPDMSFPPRANDDLTIELPGDNLCPRPFAPLPIRQCS